MNLKSKIAVTILGATGTVGQKLIELLQNHPWFEIEVLAASDKSVGKRYQDVVSWQSEHPIPSHVAEKIVHPCIPKFDTPIVFSALDSSVALEIEQSFLQAGYHVISNAKNHRNHSDVPIIIPEVNANHIELIHQQKTKGKIITNPNCVVAGLAMVIKPLAQAFGLQKMQVHTLQAISGAGYFNLSAYQILDNIIPYIADEEAKVESEPKKILGSFSKTYIEPLNCTISAQCNRVAVRNGHMANVSVSFKQKPTLNQILECWNDFNRNSQDLKLPSIPKKPIVYFNELIFPQPRFHADLEQGYSVAIGKLAQCPCLDFKLTLLVNNLVRGAAGCSILNAELLCLHIPLLSEQLPDIAYSH